MKNKIKSIFPIFIVFAIISCIAFLTPNLISWALKKVNFSKGMTISYTYAPLEIGSDVNAKIPNDCVKVIFDYNKPEYAEIINKASVTEEEISATNYKCNKGGISLFYDSDTKTSYILSNKSIYVSDCSSMFKKLTQKQVDAVNEKKQPEEELVEYVVPTLEEVVFNNFNINPRVNEYNMAYMFSGCSALKTVDLSSLDTSKVTSFQDLFLECTNLESVNLSGKFNTNNASLFISMFENCSKLTEINLSNFNTSKATNMGRMFYGCSGLTSLDVSAFDTINVARVYEMFSGCSSLTSLNVSNFNTAKIISFRSMFQNCKNLTEIDVSNFTTNVAVNTSGMFAGCEEITSLDLSSFETGNITNFNSMFSGCKKLETLDLSKFDTTNAGTNATDPEGGLAGMFQNCVALKQIKFSNNFNTVNVKYFSNMFNGCSALESIDLSSFNTSNAIKLSGMFNGCASLTSLDLSRFTSTKLEYTEQMFTNCKELTTIYVSSVWDNTNLISGSNMFFGCVKLQGGNGKTYDSSNVGKTYARVDGETTPGYFTLKTTD